VEVGYRERVEGVIAALSAVPIAVSEFSLGIYLTFWGFKPSPIISDVPRERFDHTPGAA